MQQSISTTSSREINFNNDGYGIFEQSLKVRGGGNGLISDEEVKDYDKSGLAQRCQTEK